MPEARETRESKAAKEAEKEQTEPQYYKITLLNGAMLSVEIDTVMNIQSIEDFGQIAPQNKSADPKRITGHLHKTGERVLIRWEAVAYVEQAPKVARKAGF